MLKLISSMHPVKMHTKVNIIVARVATRSWLQIPFHKIWIQFLILEKGAETLD